LYSASHQLSHIIPPYKYQGTNIPIFNPLSPRSETFAQPDQPRTRSYLTNRAYLGAGREPEQRNGTVPGAHPIRPNSRCSPGARQDPISSEDSLGQYTSKTIASLAVDDVMAVHEPLVTAGLTSRVSPHRLHNGNERES